ncbi:MAG: ABC transporter substrate-binding protein [Thermodesulfobacteriota bacterium]
MSWGAGLRGFLMKKGMSRWAGIVMLFLSLPCFSACKPASPPRPPEEVRLQLKWIHQAQFAGFYMAREKGHYAREGLKVTFLEGGPGIDNAGNVLSGKADFGVLSPEDLLIHRGHGDPLTALAAIYRRSAVVFVAQSDSGIEKPSDFIGRTVAAKGERGTLEFYLQFLAMMDKLGIDTKRIKIVPFDSEYKGFLKGEVQVTPCYATAGLIKLRGQGLKLNLIRPDDYGVHFYSDILVAAEGLIDKNPDLVLRFVRASLRGWQEVVEDYTRAVQVVLHFTEQKNLELQTAMMEAMLPLVHTGEDHLGWMKPEIWQGMADLLAKEGFIKKSFNVAPAYSLRFIHELYGKKPL